MPAKQTITFKKPTWILAWLDTALKKEKEKYERCPPKPDMVPGHEAAQGWGYVVAGYSLLEAAFKAILFLRGKRVPTKHALLPLLTVLDQNDKDILREFYADYRGSLGGHIAAFPFATLDDFLANLDGDENAKGDRIGSFDWRYYLIEDKRSQKMPLVSVDYMHEIAYGCIRIVEHLTYGRSEPSKCSHSWRMRWERERKLREWLMVRVNSEGWRDLVDRLEIVWGPDYRERYDLCVFRGKEMKGCFADIPEDFGLPIIDKRQEFATFDAKEGLRNIG